MALGGNSLARPSLIGNSRLHELATKGSVVFADETPLTMPFIEVFERGESSVFTRL